MSPLITAFRIGIYFILLFCLFACSSRPGTPEPSLAATTPIAILESSEQEYLLLRTSYSREQAQAAKEHTEVAQQPLSAGDIGARWLYGPGFGKSIANISTTIIFPPYAIYLIGNSALEFAGIPSLRVTSALPEKPRSFVLDFYDGITSVPGRLAALIAGRQYQEQSIEPKEAMNMVRTFAESEASLSH